MVVMEDVTEGERSPELYVSVHDGLNWINFALRSLFICRWALAI